MSSTFYDGAGRMRKRYAGEKKVYSTTFVIASLCYSPFHLLGLAVVSRTKRALAWLATPFRGYG